MSRTSRPRVINTQKKVKEEIIRFEYPNAIASGEEVEMTLFNGSGATYYTVRNGEGVELLSLGINTPAGGKYLRVRDRDNTQWNEFFVKDYADTSMSSNELPFHNRLNFEQMMMSWGYKSFLSSSTDSIAPTLKLPDGDRLRLFLESDAAITSGTTIPAVAIVRRYLAGSDVNYKHFNTYDGGLRSNKRYWNNTQELATTVAGTWTTAWEEQYLRNEAYKYFQGGIQTLDATNAAHLIEAKIMIDDPQTEYNKYYINPSYNVLPWTRTYTVPDLNSTATDTIHTLDVQTHRFAPTIDVLHNRNKDLKVNVKDDGTAVTDIYTRMYGVRYIL